MKNIRPAFCFCLVLISLQAAAQHRKYTWPEIRWGIFHPVATIKLNRITKSCDSIYRRVLKENTFIADYNNGGRQDAYRHVFYMAAFAQKIAPRKVRRLGELHEKGNYLMYKRSMLEDGELADSLSNQMDLKNNECGINLAASGKSVSLTELSYKAVRLIEEGKAFIMKRNKDGNYLDCSGNLVVLTKQKKWSIPKCLVPSNTAYIN